MFSLLILSDHIDVSFTHIDFCCFLAIEQVFDFNCSDQYYSQICKISISSSKSVLKTILCSWNKVEALMPTFSTVNRDDILVNVIVSIASKFPFSGY